MKQIVIILSLCSLVVLPNFAAERNAQQAMECAQQFFHQQASSAQRKAVASSPLRMVKAYTMTSSSQPAFYTFARGTDDGFVLVSADDRTPAVIGYADEGTWDKSTMPENMRCWMENYQREMTWIAEHPNYAAPERTTTLTTSVSPLLGKIEWNQGTPFNDQCPSLNLVTRCVTGCVATGTAQVMMYHKHPTKGTGSHSYTSKTNQFELSANFGNTTYQWNYMLDSYKGTYTTKQGQAVATLLSHVGISCDMNYDKSSGAQMGLAGYALKTYFGYDKSIQLCSRDYYAGDWEKLIRSELDAARPVIYDGFNAEGGHCFVCDGYDDKGYFHINWGWGGSSNGYFLLTILTPGSQGLGGSSGGYSFGQGALIHVKPDAGGSSPQIAKFTYDSLTVDKTSWGQFGKVTFTAVRLQNNSVDEIDADDLAILIMQNNQVKDKISLNFLSSLFDTYSQGSYNTEEFSGTTITLADGTYDVALGYKEDSYSQWKLVCGRGGVPYYYTLVAEDGNRTLKAKTQNESEPWLWDVFSNNPLVDDFGAIVNFKLYLNAGYHDFRDTIRLAFKNIQTQKEAYQSPATYVDIAAGEFDTLTMRIHSLPDAGDYQVVLHYGKEKTDVWWNTLHILSADSVITPHAITITQRDTVTTISWESICDSFQVAIYDSQWQYTEYVIKGKKSLTLYNLPTGDYNCSVTSYYADPLSLVLWYSPYYSDFVPFTVKAPAQWYYIVAQRKATENFYFFTPDKVPNKSRLVAVNAGCSIRTQIDTIATSASYLWKVESVGDSVLLQNWDGQYLACTSAKSASMAKVGVKMMQTVNKDGTSTFSFPAGTNTRYLSLGASGSDFFVFYENANQTTHLYLLPQGDRPTGMEDGNDNHNDNHNENENENENGNKVIRNGVLYIERDGKTYNVQGTVVQ